MRGLPHILGAGMTLLCLTGVIVASDTNTPPLPKSASPIGYFRELLVMTHSEREAELAGWPEGRRAQLRVKITEYATMSATERELRLRAPELRFFLLPLMRLTPEERRQLEGLISKGQTKAYRIKHANILLKADADGPAWTDEEIAEAFCCHIRTVEAVRRRFVFRGLEAALDRKMRATPPRERILDGEKEARLIALSCSQPPEGRSRWTLELLADKMVELRIVDQISYQTVRRALKKTSSNPT